MCAYVQSVACQTQLEGNVFFNGPRADVNLNDGFGGGNLLKNNLIFNMVRETAEHGPFNSWDRQPYLTKLGTEDGSASLIPVENYLINNFFISNYQSTWPINHDDGSCYYTDQFNFLVYGGYKNYLGHTVRQILIIFKFTLMLGSVTTMGLLFPFVQPVLVLL